MVEQSDCESSGETSDERSNMVSIINLVRMARKNVMTIRPELFLTVFSHLRMRWSRVQSFSNRFASHENILI